MKKFVKENWFKLVISVAIIIFAVSISYYFLYIPFKKNHDLNRCLSESSNNLLRQQIDMNNQIDSLEKSKMEASAKADIELAEFLKNNPEPSFKLLPITGPRVSYEDLKRQAKENSANIDWQKNKNSIFDNVNSMGRQIGELEKRRDNIIGVEKKELDEECYKKYK